jgi:hypothetical protein
MPDFVLFAKALLVSAVTAGLTLLLVAWPERNARPWRLRAGWIAGLAAGIYAGCGVLDQWPRWPAPEDRDRFLVILLPLTLAVEAASAWLPSRWPARLLRWGVAAAAAPILLYNTTYLADLAGPNSAEWSPDQAALILAALGAALAGEWELLALFQSRTSERAASPVLVFVLLASGITVMLSSYYRGGLLGFPLAGAISGATLASYARMPHAAASQSHGGNNLGVGLVGTFTLLVIGRFFGALPTGTMICLFAAPLVAWVSEVPPVRKWSPRARALTRLVAVAVPLILIVTWAQMRFIAAFSARSKPIEPQHRELSFPEK